MKKLLATFLIYTLCFQLGFSQEIDKTLGKAFTSKDSSDYYFKIAKRQIKSDRDEAQFYFCKGARHGDYNQLDSAIYYSKKAIVVFEKMKDLKTLNTLYNNISQSYRKQGEYDKSIQASILGLQNAEKSKSDFWIFYFTDNLSVIYHDFENFDKGIYYGKKALAFAKKLTKDRNANIAGALNAIAISYDDSGRPNEALYYHKQVFNYIKGKDTLAIGHTYNNIGNTLLKQKKYKEAEKWIKIAVAITEANEKAQAGRYDVDFYNKATNFTNLAVIATKTKEFEKAELFLKKAKFNSVKSNNAEKLRDYYRAEYEYNKERNNLQKTVESQEQYIKLRDSVFNKNRDKSFLEIEAKYQNEKKEKELLNKELEIKKKDTQSLILAITIIGLLIICFLIYRQQKLQNSQQKQEFELKSAIAKIETQNKLQEQRLQISRDLHDNIGSQLTFIISSVDNIKYAFEIQNSKLDNKLSSISNFAKSTIIELRDTIWAMNNSEITFEDLQTRIHNFVEKAKEAKHTINFDFTIEESLLSSKFTSIEGMNIYRSIQEGVNNSIKYAEAQNIKIGIKHQKEKIVIKIQDDGKGFDAEKVKFGNGIANMKKRIEEIGGKFTIASSEKGTMITIVIK
ncbi:tetratricopeptide repeat-containing sensor histidine kinase [Flavobacterium wongokense]|uniref:tetratricopeptide repeat-containing sensor histidine kinase n=1 Tax=Flavobacterium wongokense TaxID=2910674 RepID=UPI001F1994D4|nr:tetratricopeptide repeat-containing sensor histidine kinase [Flavobacterium sp. WG47]MCF6130864.1 tetratricopeptide repeat protein [Flavobacterium sp. WG47]